MRKTLPKQNKTQVVKPFDFLNIFFEKKEIPEDAVINNLCEQWILNMTLSCDRQFAEIAHEMSKIKITNKMYFDCMYYGIPEGKRYIKYNAKKATRDKEIQYLMEYYNCSQQVAKEYQAIIDETEIKEIKEYFEKRGMK